MGVTSLSLGQEVASNCVIFAPLWLQTGLVTPPVTILDKVPAHHMQPIAICQKPISPTCCKIKEQFLRVFALGNPNYTGNRQQANECWKKKRPIMIPNDRELGGLSLLLTELFKPATRAGCHVLWMAGHRIRGKRQHWRFILIKRDEISTENVS